MCYKILSRNGVPSIKNNAFLSLFVVLFVNLDITFGGHHWRFVHPRPHRNYSLRRRLPRPPCGPAPPGVSEIALLPNDLSSSSSAATAQQLRTEGRVVYRRLCRQHAKVKLDKASQFVPADVAHCIRFNSKVFAGTPQQALLKAYEEATAEEE